MKHGLVLLVLLCVLSWAQSIDTSPQSLNAAPIQPPGVALSKLYPPIYPPLSRQARVTGDVQLELSIRPDGSVATVKVINGHPMLKQAAVESAQKSQFVCVGCTDSKTYRMTYTFDLFDDDACRPTVTKARVRSPKCLYLWKCGDRITTEWSDNGVRQPEITQSEGNVKIVVSPVCIQTIDSRLRRSGYR